MASVSNLLRTCSLICCVILSVLAADDSSSKHWIMSFKVDSKKCGENNCKYLLSVSGGEFLGHYSWRLSPEEGFRGDKCDGILPNYELHEVETTQWYTKIELSVPNEHGRIYFCLHNSEKMNSPFGGRWIHQGVDLFLDPKNDVVSPRKDEKSDAHRSTGDLDNSLQSVQDNDLQVPKANLEDLNSRLPDLSHDTDVNFKPGRPRLTRDEGNHIEVLENNRYIPLNDLETRRWRRGALALNEGDSAGLEVLGNDGYVNQKGVEALEKGRYVPMNDLETRRWRRGALALNEGDSAGLEVLGNDGYVNQKGMEALEKGRYVPMNDLETLRHDTFALNEGESDGLKVLNNRYVPGNLETVTRNEDVTYGLRVLENDGNINQRVAEGEQFFTREMLDPNRLAFKTSAVLSTDGKYRRKRDILNGGVTTFKPLFIEDMLGVQLDAPFKRDGNAIRIEGLRIEDSAKEPIIEEGVPSVLAASRVTLRLFGAGLTTRTVVAFTHDALAYGMPCKFLVKGEYLAKKDSVTASSALFEITAPHHHNESRLYICAKNLKPGVADPFDDEEKYYHQGTEPWTVFATHNNLLPLWATMTLILSCLMFSALFSGLNLGLMSLDRTELKIIANTGTEQERKYARAIMPVRDHGNYLLCSILLGNVAVNSTFTILLDELTSGLFAVILSTLAIVLLGEITPQAICSRHGLMVGAKSICVTKAVMALTAPLAFPVSKLLDYFLGEEIGSVYNRERLKELVKVTTDVNDLDRDEVNIISGALELRKKRVCDVMTKLEDVFMLPISSVLDFETMSEIVKSGFSRIPVYEHARTNIVTVLFIKDLAFVDPDDNTPLQTLCHYYQNPCNFVFEDVTLDIMFRHFKDGHKGHMAFVHRINSEGEGDPFYETVGLVTLEDVIEEMIQAEIVDETDVFSFFLLSPVDNRSKRRRNRPQNKLQDFTAFAERHENQRIHISPQLTLATFQFLSTSVDAFRPDIVSETVLRRLLQQDVIQHIKLKGKTKRDVSTYVYQQGKPVDYFVLLLEGRVEVTVGRENLVFEAGPFTYFGSQALTQNVGVAESPTPSAMGSLQNINMDAMLRHTFVPDYSVRAITELYYLTVKRSMYLAAKRASLMEKGVLTKGATNDLFDTEVDKLLQSVDEDLSVSGEHRTPSRQVSPNPVPTSASPHTRSHFTAAMTHNGDCRPSPDCGEQEKLLK